MCVSICDLFHGNWLIWFVYNEYSYCYQNLTNKFEIVKLYNCSVFGFCTRKPFLPFRATWARTFEKKIISEMWFLVQMSFGWSTAYWRKLFEISEVSVKLWYQSFFSALKILLIFLCSLFSFSSIFIFTICDRKQV